MQSKTALICGLGSIGKRHLENLETLGFSCKDILVYRTQKGSQPFGDNVLQHHGHRHPVFYDLDQALSKLPQITFITNPTAYHISLALKAAKARSHLYIEKPLSHSLEGVHSLEKEILKKNIFATVAYNLRFHPLMGKIKNWLDEKILGEIISCQAEIGERITHWHPWENHEISYASREDLGGGAILTQSHELDYLYWFFGMPEMVFSAGGILGDLQMNVENCVSSIIKYPTFYASLYLDYYKHPPRRTLQITGTKGRLEWNDLEKKCSFLPLQGNPIFYEEPKDFDRNHMYLAQLKDFLTCIQKNKSPSIDFRQGADVLKIALAMKASLKTGKKVNLT